MFKWIKKTKTPPEVVEFCGGCLDGQTTCILSAARFLTVPISRGGKTKWVEYERTSRSIDGGKVIYEFKQTLILK